jgi:hypothetical protein
MRKLNNATIMKAIKYPKATNLSGGIAIFAHAGSFLNALTITGNIENVLENPKRRR